MHCLHNSSIFVALKILLMTYLVVESAHLTCTFTPQLVIQLCFLSHLFCPVSMMRNVTPYNGISRIGYDN